MFFKIYNAYKPMPEKEFDLLFSLMLSSFPDNEHRNMTGQKALTKDELYHIMAAYSDDSQKEFLGFIAFWNFPAFVYVEHFAVDGTKRNLGIGSKILAELMNFRNASIVLEVELPKDEMTKRRLGFYQRHNFILNDYDYLQPPMQKGFAPLPLKIMSYPSSLSQKDFSLVETSLHSRVYKAFPQS